MWCVKCDKNLVDCECPDLQERLDRASKCPSLTITVAQVKIEIEAKKKNIQPHKN